MSSDVDVKTIKATQDLLSKIIAKPVMTEKLLKRPPFRFLHDIISNIIKTNGSMEGLYSAEELEAENVKDKDAKVMFLQKAIDLTGFLIGDVLAVKPTKVVAGLEADKTNQWLQALAKAIISKKDDKSAVQKVLNGEKPTKQAKSSQPTSNSNKKQPTEVNGTATGKQDNKTKAKTSTSNTTKGKSVSQKKEETKPKVKPRDNSPSVKKSSNVVESKPIEQSNIDESITSKETENRKQSPSLMVNNHEKESKEIANEEKEKEEPNQQKGDNEEYNNKSNVKTNDNPSSGDVIAHRENKQHSKHIKSAVREAPRVSPRPPTSSGGRPFTARPGSARPAPPKIVIKREVEEEQQRLLELEEKNRLQNAKPVENLILDKLDDEDEEKEYEVEDTGLKLEEDEQMPNQHLGVVGNEESQKGSLVKQLIETKKELEGNELQENEMNGESNLKLAARDIEKLRQNIQSLSKTVTPLGRVVDYLQEDIDSMMTELKVWKEEYKKNMIIVEKEKNMINHELEPLRAQLNVFDSEIEEQADKISSTKASIIRNEERIQKMISIINKAY